jgi:hypothetical protein
MVTKYKENPFIDKLMEELKPVKKRKFVLDSSKSIEHNIVTGSSGEIVGTTSLFTVVEIDPEPFVKMYKDSIKSFWGLTEASYKVLDYIKEVLIPDKDEFYLYAPDVMEYTKYKQRRSIESAVNQLISKEIIAKSIKPNMYFINPTVLFNGDRLIIANAYVKRKVKSNNTNQLALFNNSLIPHTGLNTEEK